MTPFYSDEWLTLYGGDARTVLAELPADSVDCVVTSPPYWGLRSYIGDDDPNKGMELGLERTPEEYVANMVAVFREVRRVLKPSGTCWLNLGDSYANTGKSGGGDQGRRAENGAGAPTTGRPGEWKNFRPAPDGLKPKDLVGIPWRVAFALQADGWYLRSDIIWSKPNPMPESVTDRPTKSHEYLFLLTKSARYYFDADAVREPATTPQQFGLAAVVASGLRREMDPSLRHHGGETEWSAGRNIRSVWTIATRPYPGAHFAVFPPELPERCIKAGSSERGVCAQLDCGEPFERVVERESNWQERKAAGASAGSLYNGHNASHGARMSHDLGGGPFLDLGWKATCSHHDLCPHPNLAGPCTVAPVVLDPFAGSGTVGMVANRLSRRAILIDLNPEYLKQQMKRNAQTPLGLSA